MDVNSEHRTLPLTREETIDVLRDLQLPAEIGVPFGLSALGVRAVQSALHYLAEPPKTCETCKHWTIGHTVTAPPEWGYCSSQAMFDAAGIDMFGELPKTDANFGCLLHAPREEGR